MRSTNSLSFFKHVLSSGLVEKAVLQKIFRIARKKFDEAPSSSTLFLLTESIPNDRWEPFDYVFAEELIRKKLLNSWQTSQLLSGRARFTLGNYQIENSLGRGGYGMVFLARHTVFDNTFLLEGEARPLYALKVLPGDKATPELVERFRREIEIQKGLQHPNIVRFVDSGFDGNVHYMAQEYIDGGNLRKRIRKEKTIPLHEAAKIVSQTADALAYLHSCGIVHRDIKPSNILLTRAGDVKLSDFGLSVHIQVKTSTAENALVSESIREIENQEDTEELPETLTGTYDGEGLKRKVAGTADYLAPDQVLDTGHPNKLWDIYSLGCTFYHAVSGIVPFPGGTPQQKIFAHVNQEPPDVRMFCDSLPDDIALLIGEMMCRDPQERISSLKSISRRLEPWTSLIEETLKVTIPELDSFQLPAEPVPEVPKPVTMETSALSQQHFTFIRFPSTGDVLRIEIPPVLDAKIQEAGKEIDEPLNWNLLLPMLMIVLFLVLCIIVKL